MKYDPATFMKRGDELGRVLRCAYMAMGCLDATSANPDERLAWLRLSDAFHGLEPRGRLND
jgi:hypothetical protein